MLNPANLIFNLKLCGLITDQGCSGSGMGKLGYAVASLFRREGTPYYAMRYVYCSMNKKDTACIT
jgi:hypothetical protein